MTPGRAVWRLFAAKPVHATVWSLVVAAFVVTSTLRGDVRVWPYLTVVLVCTALGAIADRSVGFSDTTLWLLVLVGTLHLSGGLVPDPAGRGVLYETWLLPHVLRYDQLVHTIGSAVATLVSWQMLGTWLDLRRTPPKTQALLAALAGLGKGALNEVFEFAVAVGVPGTYVGGFLNTGWDLVFDVAGCVAAAVFLVWSGAARRPAPRDAAALAERSVADVAA